MPLTHIFDTHSHYDDPKFDPDRYELIASLFSRGISGIVHAATDLDSTRFGLEISRKFEKYYAAAGIHPDSAERTCEDDLYEVRALAKSSKKVVAIGEIGLDYHYEGFDRGAQTDIFRKQIDIANELGLPVIVHCRDAVGDCLQILREKRPKGVMHCFSGSWESARELLGLGFYIGFTGALTFKNAKKAVEVAQKMPLDRLVLETDCPYMAPEPFRGRRSDSSMILMTAARAAEIRGIDPDDLAAAAEQNAKRLFGIDG